MLTLCEQEAHAMQQKVSAQYVNEIEMAKSQRDFELKKAIYDMEVNSKKAESEMAYQLQVNTPYRACTCMNTYTPQLLSYKFRINTGVF